MFEQLKAALVTFLVIFIFFVGGVLVGLKLPETKVYKEWAGIHQELPQRLPPTKVAVIQIPGAQVSTILPGETPAAGDQESCPGGVCKLPEPGQTPHQAAVAEPPKNLDLTFYQELADKPTESGGSALIVKKTPIVRKTKPSSMTAARVDKPVAGSQLWELRVCSLPQEIKARLERSKLIKDFPGVNIEPVQVAGKGTWYRIKISDIKDRATAERYLQELSRKYHYKPLLRQQ